VPGRTIVPADGGEHLAVGGGRLRIALAGEDSGGSLALLEYEVPAGFPGPPLHVHPDFDEVFVVLEGTLWLRTGDEAVAAEAGAVAYVAGDEPHTFANPSEQAVRMLVALLPAGFERFFREVAAAGERAIADPALVGELNRRHGVTAIP
jgi:quercetin dioxygenase-like cupin family protein